MRRAMLALVLTGCGAAQHAGSSVPAVALSYEVVIDPALSAMDVTVCPRSMPLPDAMVPVHDEADDHVSAAVLIENGVPIATLPSARRLDLTAAPAHACLRYHVDLATCTAPRGPAGCAHVGDDLFAPTSTWLLAPETRRRSARYALHFVLPEGVSVTPISEQASRDPSHVVLDDRNFAFVTYVAFVHAALRITSVPGGCVDVATLDGHLDATFDARAHWLSVAAEASSRVTGEMPFDRLTAIVVPAFDAPGMPVLFGVAGRGMRPTVTLLVSEHATEAQLVPDWTLVHELSHFLTAYVDGEDTWLSEGLATYYQEVLRVRQGLISETDAWAALTRGFVRGRAESTSGTLRDACASMHATRSYTRVYWQGAALVLLADVAYRRNGSSLDAAVARAWPHRGERASAAELLAWLDGTPGGTFAALAAASLDAEGFPDVASTLEWLGVRVDEHGAISLDARAPGAAVRTALMNGDGRFASNTQSCAGR